jgi:hypothetical protein
MTANTPDLARNSQRRDFIGGSDARINMGGDEGALLRIWREKRGEVEPQDLSGNLIVRLGSVATEHFKRHWHELTSGAGRATPEPREGGRALQSEKIAGDEESSLLCPSMRKTWRGYLRFGCRRFRSRRPSPPPFSSMNSIPARSKAARIASTAPRETSRRSFSKSTTVESPRSAAWASCDCVIPSSPRAARHWAGVILSTFFIDTCPDVSYQ